MDNTMGTFWVQEKSNYMNQTSKTYQKDTIMQQKQI